MPVKIAIWNQRMILLMRHCIDTQLCDTQKDFFSSIGFSPTALRQIREGTQSFTLEHIVAAAKKYKINVNWIMGLESEMFRAKKKNALQNLKDAVRAIEAESPGGR